MYKLINIFVANGGSYSLYVDSDSIRYVSGLFCITINKRMDEYELFVILNGDIILWKNKLNYDQLFEILKGE